MAKTVRDIRQNAPFARKDTPTTGCALVSISAARDLIADTLRREALAGLPKLLSTPCKNFTVAHSSRLSFAGGEAAAWTRKLNPFSILRPTQEKTQ